MSQSASSTFQFGDFEANFETGELLKAGTHVLIQPKTFALLRILANAAGNSISRQELKLRLWPEAQIRSDVALSVAIHKLRQAISDSANSSQHVITVPCGYRFQTAAINDIDNQINTNGRIAVLPLRVCAPRELEEFADGLVEDLITFLARSGIHVVLVPPKSVPRDRRGEGHVPQICHELNASKLLTGTLRSLDGQIHVNLRLIQAETQDCIWASSCTRHARSFSTVRRLSHRFGRLLVEYLGSN